ncbi:hypothetical protein [Idiomarina aminovorans]|uniref:hypothetical protein n=1 Tax=Idiomarina aminovorans TaxID=2914829 RepID=UPI0020039E01|nr:hypothetical protein [Idiomarina sp. ATCH4]MCK7459499.1 hypothetical protein [Idiomarina sp. ATCH4]
MALNNAHKQFRHANEFSAWAVAEMKRLKKLESVEQEELAKLEGSENNPVYITVFIPKQQPQVEAMLIRSLQKYGFSLVIEKAKNGAVTNRNVLSC